MSKRWILVALATTAGVATVVTLSMGDPQPRQVVAAGEAADTAPTTVPELPEGLPAPPAVLNSEAVRANCPDPPNPAGPGNVVSSNYDYAAGFGEPTPQAALARFVRAMWPGARVDSFLPTAAGQGEVHFENPFAAVAVAGGDGSWRVEAIVECRPIAAKSRVRP